MTSHNIKPVPLEDMIWRADPNEFDFETTADIKLPENPIDIVKGQENAKKVIKRAINSHENVILLGHPGCGKSLLTKAVANQFSKQQINKKQLYDQVAVHNFLDEDSPTILSLPTPKGTEFVKDLKYFVKHFAEAIEKDLGINNEVMRTKVSYSFGEKKEGFDRTVIKTTLGELVQRATGNGSFETIEGYEKELEVSSKEDLFTKQILLGKQGGVSKLIYGVTNMFSFGTMKMTYVERTHSLMDRFGTFDLEVISDNEKTDTWASKLSGEINEILSKYGEYDKVGKFIESVKDEISQSPEIFKDGSSEHSPEHLNDMKRSRLETEREKFRAKLLVDNSETIGIPVEYVENPSIQNLLGEAGHDAYNSTPQHLRLKPGKLHRGNGGIVIVDEIINLLQYQEVRNKLLTVFEEKKGSISGGSGMGGGTSAAIESEPADADCVVIGCANEDVLEIFQKYPKIARRFPQKVTMNSVMENTLENRMGYAEFIKYTIDEHNNNPETLVEIPHYSPDGVAAIVERGVRLAQNTDRGKGKLTNILSSVGGIVINSGIIAQENGSKVVGKEHVLESIKENKEIYSHMEKKILSGFEDESKNFQIDGYQVGEVNGLVIMKDPFGLYMVGCPQKIETSIGRGRGFKVNSIDQLSGLSGKIMKKANNAIESFLKNKFIDQNMDGINLNFNFSQAYGGIDGDSASISTTLALLSRFSGIPANQSYAITGSMDLKGKSQVIAGVNEKIEGFYNVCKQKDFKGSAEYGALIPKSNVRDLMLPEEIIENKKFHVYPISHLEDAVEIVLNSSMKKVEEGIKNTIEKYPSKK